MFAKRHFWTTVAKLFAVFALTTNVAHAWNGVGHRGIAKLAWTQLTPEARDMVFELLTSGIDIPETDKCWEQFVVSQTDDKAAAFVRSVSWMDCSRGGGTEYRPLPYAALVHADRRSLCPATYTGSTPYCTSGRCTTLALEQAIKDLNDPWAPVKTRRVAVKIILHFLTDLHQPLHAAQPGKDFLVRVDRQSEPISLHSYWDGVVPQLVWAEKDANTTLKKLMASKGAEFKKGSVEDWVKESARRSSQAFGDLVGADKVCTHDPKAVVTVTPEYAAKAAELGRSAIASSVVRLAEIFNAAAVRLTPYKETTHRAIAMGKVVKDSGTPEQRAEETRRILTAAGIDPSLVKPNEEDDDTQEHTTNTLGADQSLFPGQSLLSSNQRYELLMQLDGNLVIYERVSTAEVQPRWASHTERTEAVEAILQEDGNFVLYDGKSGPLWASGTNVWGARKKATHAVLENDGRFVLYDQDKKAVWTANAQRD